MTSKPKQNDFLPISKSDMRKRGIEQLDFICVTGDSYVDHPTFGTAIISRVIEAEGFSVGILAQPGFRNANDMQKLGRPKYAFMVSSGNIDSMVAHYTVAKRKRSDDAYTAGGKAGRRPDRALTVYCKLIREAYPDIPIIIGGLEASLRRFAHYDYWDDAVHPSILCSTTADLLVYGMGEKQTIEIVHRLASGESVDTMTDIRGTCYLTDPVNTPFTSAQCPDFDAVCRDKKLYAKAAKIQMAEQDEVRGKTIIQRHGKKMLVQNPPMTALNGEELDRIYELPYMRTYHPSYESEGGVPAIKEVEFSITHNRGCFGACNFCSIAFHQGRKVTCRTHESVVREAQEMTKNPHFKGYISDVGGPTANFRQPSCAMQKEHGLCKEKKCLAPRPCKNLLADHSDYVSLLRKLREIKGIKKVFIRSGIRYDYMLSDPDDTFFKELVRYHVSGQLRVAPEHCSANVLDKMGKPHIEAYHIFLKKYREETAKIGKEQYLVPYLMSSHPGSTLNDAIELALFLKEAGIHPDQVQDFYPTPGTVSTCMYHTGIDPISGESVFVPKTPEEKAMQRALLQYYKPENREIVRKALILANRRDLIGNRPGCLIPDLPVRSANKRMDTAQNKRRTSWQNERRTKNTKRTKR
ncbi:YgiQ family radical SAM protein [Phocea massiliensis]|uniref:YgiQ family radical SAM protein n=1 Tax=Merdimmobilis hominis TaxID=2897707 RepID=A0A939BDC4_9FIRM|nr:YgiQ family radical SAM protein [Merdimmobilis hominis]MBM6919721.1 YgiQ family radical SAM protein [Merdimmobilis hominis]